MNLWNLITALKNRRGNRSIASQTAYFDAGKTIFNGAGHQDTEQILQLMRMALDFEAEAPTPPEELVSYYEQDTGASARLMRLANSQNSGDANAFRITWNVRDAVRKVGSSAALEVALAMQMRKVFSSSRETGSFSPQALWTHCLASGIACRLLYRHIFGNVGNTAAVFLAGMMHDIGLILEYENDSENRLAAAISAQAAHGSRLVDEEEQHLGISHPHVGAAVARRWGLPPTLVDAISVHHDLGPEVTEMETIRLVHIMRVADWICMEMGFGYSDITGAQAHQYMDSLQALDLDVSTCRNLGQTVGDELRHFERVGLFSNLRLRVPAAAA